MKKALKNVFASQELKLNIFLYRWEDQSHGQSRQEGELCAVARHPLPIPYPQNFLYESSYPRHFVVPGWWWPEVTSKGTSFLLLSTSPGTAPSSTASIFQVNHISECHCLFFSIQPLSILLIGVVDWIMAMQRVSCHVPGIYEYIISYSKINFQMWLN